MQRLQAFKYELMPSGEHVRNMRRFAGARAAPNAAAPGIESRPQISGFRPNELETLM